MLVRNGIQKKWVLTYEKPQENINDGKSFERLAQVIFQTLLSQKDLKNIEVRHDIVRDGKSGKHQIDVYWEFSLSDGLTYRTVVECRDWARRITQERIMGLSCKAGRPECFLGNNGN